MRSLSAFKEQVAIPQVKAKDKTQKLPVLAFKGKLLTP